MTGYKSLGMGTVTRCLWGDEDDDCGDKTSGDGDGGTMSLG